MSNLRTGQGSAVSVLDRFYRPTNKKNDAPQEQSNIAFSQVVLGVVEGGSKFD